MNAAGKFIAVLLVCLASARSGHAIAASPLVVNVLPDTAEAPADLAALCQVGASRRCAGRLPQVLGLLQDPQWLGHLRGAVDAVQVVFARGTYRLDAPMRIRWGKGDTQGIRLELSGQGAWGGSAMTLITGARVLPAAVQADAPAIGMQVPARLAGKVQAFDLSAWPPFSPPPARGFGLPIRPVTGELFSHDAVLPLAGWPNAGYGRVERDPGDRSDDRLHLSVQGRDATDWKAEPDLRVFAYWFHDWAAQTYPAAVAADGRLTLSGAGAAYGIRSGQRLRIDNALSELDMPGEWYLDRAAQALLVWPTAPGQLFELSFAQSLLEIEDAQGLLVRGMAFEKSRGDVVTVRNSENVVLDGVSIRNAGNRALVVEGGRACGLRNALVEHTGEGGVLLSGGDRRTLEAAGHFLENSTVRDFSRLSKTYRFAAELAGVGQRVVGNVISQAPHTAILFSGNDHRIANNEIFAVVQETSDAGAIYTGRDFTARGTVIEGNFLHDIQADDPAREVKGVYLDDQASGITVRANIFARVQQPVFIGGGRDNAVENNLFYHSSPAITLDARGLDWQRAATLDPQKDLQARLNAIAFNAPPYSVRYPNLAKIRSDDFGAPKYNRFDNNLVVGGEALRVSKAAGAGSVSRAWLAAGEDVFAVPLTFRVRREDFAVRPGAWPSLKKEP